MPSYVISSPTYEPARKLITAITNAAQAAVTTSTDHDYLSGLIVRIKVPMRRFGMTQINNLLGVITVTGDTTFTIDIDTRTFDTFVIPDPEENFTSAFPQVIPVGEITTQLDQALRNVL